MWAAGMKPVGFPGIPLPALSWLLPWVSEPPFLPSFPAVLKSDSEILLLLPVSPSGLAPLGPRLGPQPLEALGPCLSPFSSLLTCEHLWMCALCVMSSCDPSLLYDPFSPKGSS